jgi:hypothetical protein
LDKINKNKIIYIAGFPRSGTTWFANLLNSHSGTIYRHELIGRNHQTFGLSLYKKMKFDNGVSNEQHDIIMSRIFMAEPGTDRPPFFVKEKGTLKYPMFHHSLWLLAKTFPKALSKPYNWIFKIKADDSYKILMKETGEAKFIESFRNSLRPYVTLFLVRNPLAAISSHIKGINRGSMPAITNEEKRRRLEEIKNVAPEQASVLAQLIPETMSDAVFFALKWRDYHEKVIAYCKKYNDYHIYLYDEIVADSRPQVHKILNDVGLEWEQQVNDFIVESSGKGKPSNVLKKLDSIDSFYSVFREPTFKKENWLELMSEEEIEFITLYTAPILNTVKQLCNKKKG